VEPGQLDGDMVHVPGIYVQRIVKVDRPSYFPSID
jgi:acyl CoA:acetate/3-ketoacid CoA transferase alpha subunit